RPFRACKPSLNGYFPRDFLFVPIGNRSSIRNLSPPLRHACGVEQRRHQLRLAGAAVAYNANVSNVLSRIDFHTDLQLSSPARGERRGPSNNSVARACAVGKLVLREESVASFARAACGRQGRHAQRTAADGLVSDAASEAKDERKLPWSVLLT